MPRQPEDDNPHLYTNKPDLMVTKRNGLLVPWDAMKIEAAVNKALVEVNDPDPDGNAYTVTDSVCQTIGNHPNYFAKHNEPTPAIYIEHIQDEAEKALMGVSPAAAKAFILYREKRAEGRAHKAPEGAVTDYIHASKYARWLPKLKRRELHAETVTRVMDMHIRRFPSLEAPIRRHFKLVYDKRVMPSMRSMQFGGAAIEAHHARMYNCSFTLVDRPEVFGQSLYLLLCGCGVGYSVQKQHVAKLPPMGVLDKKKVHHYECEDTIEGWADSITALITAHIEGFWIEFNYSKIRDEGVQLKTSGGKAPGHIPLKIAHIKIGRILGEAAGRRLKPIECHDIMCHSAEAVLAGGIRRSSLISLFSPDDEEMMTCKTPAHFSWGGKNAQREMANNSAVFLRSNFHKTTIVKAGTNEGDEAQLSINQEAHDQFRQMFDFAVKHYGEPGFFLTDNLDYGTNPCGEIGLNPVMFVEPNDAEDEALLKSQGLVEGKGPNGTGGLVKTGFAFCNLCEINMARNLTPDQCYEASQAAAFIGTLQASYTSFPYLGETTELIAKREALLGVGMTGMMDNPAMSFNDEVVREMALQATQANLVVASHIGIKQAARVTTVKPSGTASLALGMIGSGIHGHHAKRYFRRITANPGEPVAQYFKSINPHMVMEKTNGDWCLTFPVEAPAGALTVKQMKAKDFLDFVFRTYESWIKPGTVYDKHSPGLTHNVSSTVVVDEGEWDVVFDLVWTNRHRIQAMSFLPRTGDKGSPYMPREEVLIEDEPRWAALIREYKPVDYSAMVENEDGTTAVMEPACSGGACQIVV